MKKIVLSFAAVSVLSWIAACNNSGNDSMQKADSANMARIDSTGTVTSDKKTALFLVQADGGGMSEIKMGDLARQKAHNKGVTDFAEMMIKDHSAVNDTLQELASNRNIMLPDSIGEDSRKSVSDLRQKSGLAFDRAYMDEMVHDHESAIRDFEQASNDVGDSAVRTFIQHTLPLLRKHLESARAIQKSLKH